MPADSRDDRRGGLLGGRILWLALPAAGVVFFGASSPWIAQRVPRFFFPTLAAAGAGLVVLSLATSLRRFIRRCPDDGGPRLRRVVVNVVAALFLVVLPLVHLVRAIVPPGDGTPRILAGFGDWLGPEGYPRPSPHRGLDVAGRMGADVLARRTAG